jgi:hypothetical protein
MEMTGSKNIMSANEKNLPNPLVVPILMTSLAFRKRVNAQVSLYSSFEKKLAIIANKLH